MLKVLLKELQVLLSPAVMVTLTMNAHIVPNAQTTSSITENILILIIIV